MADKLTPSQYFERVKSDNQRAWLSEVMDGAPYQEMTVQEAKTLAENMHLWMMRFAQDYHVGMSVLEADERKSNS